MAASATFALKAGVWFRRGRLDMVSPDSQATACLPSGRNSTYRPVQISATGSLLSIAKQLRFAELQDLGIVSNRVSLGNLIAQEGFPPGRKLGANTACGTPRKCTARPSNPKPPIGAARRRHEQRIAKAAAQSSEQVEAA